MCLNCMDMMFKDHSQDEFLLALYSFSSQHNPHESLS